MKLSKLAFRLHSGFLLQPLAAVLECLRRVAARCSCARCSPVAPDRATLRLAILRATTQGDARALSELLRLPGADPNSMDLLVRAVELGSSAVVGVLLAHGATDPNRPRRDGTTALMAAVLTRRADLVAALMSHPRIEPRRLRNDGKTAWSLAIDHGDRACIAALRQTVVHLRTSAS